MIKVTDEDVRKVCHNLETKRIAKELAPELDRLINNLLESLNTPNHASAYDALSEFLMDNKIGILRILQAIDYL